MVDLSDLNKLPQITRKTVEETRAKEPKRICFSVYETGEPKRSKNPSFVGTFNVPFGEGFSRLFPWTLFPNKHDKFHKESVWLSISDEQEFLKIEAWVKSQGPRVFLRDCLSTSVALSHNFCNTTDGKRTDIGQLEFLAKNQHDADATRTLSKYSLDAIRELEHYRTTNFIAAVPPRPSKEYDLPSEIVKQISNDCSNMSDITGYFHFGNDKHSLKSVSLDGKWDSWEEADLSIDCDLTGKDVILLDDKYQSGCTIQFVAMKLQEAGARQIFGLSLVKTMRDTDNQ
ncbi:MAG: hypothetical protein IID08_01500 [Candidatus Hydrogenedentes bacterium]|nr:hypothetical protein [Candidatus Hydrogenedentota bacterium]